MTEPLSATIAANIRALRTELRMSQRLLGEAAGVSQVAVSGWERGEGITAVNLVAVANALEVPVTRLLGRDGPDAFWDGYTAGWDARGAQIAAEVAP